MITNQFPDFKHTNFQISTPTPFEVYLFAKIGPDLELRGGDLISSPVDSI